MVIVKSTIFYLHMTIYVPFMYDTQTKGEERKGCDCIFKPCDCVLREGMCCETSKSINNACIVKHRKDKTSTCIVEKR